MSGNLLFLGGLPNDIREDEVHRHLSIYGKITEIKIRPGFGFVRFASEKDAKDVVTMFSHRQFLGADVSISIARPYRKESGGDTKANSSPAIRTKSPSRHDGVDRYPVVIEKMNPNTTWKDLMHFGRLAGEVLFVALDRHRPGRGYINYTTPKDAECAVKKLSGRIFLGNAVTVALHQDRYAVERPKSVSDRSCRGRSRSRSPVRWTKNRENPKYRNHPILSDARDENRAIPAGPGVQHNMRTPVKSDFSADKHDVRDPRECLVSLEPFQKSELHGNTNSERAEFDTDVDRMAAEWLNKHFDTEAWRNVLTESSVEGSSEA
ncbi:hypothetical protein SCP_0207770 [Sparassis crispa]|uniref:RRM domain-containing protein n=1 Tax=Sparassis crispa TaxID=139825 RepID=A0A401GBQ0_9APHY|nr:hypothetical protein SCP_0207770 [Sparassis crispa]GBE79577.1 hypothetical protein SCP_0207770 [Sparassis crispa]